MEKGSKRLYSIGIVIKSSDERKVKVGLIKITRGRRPMGCNIPVVIHGSVKTDYVVRYDSRVMAESVGDALLKYWRRDVEVVT